MKTIRVSTTSNNMPGLICLFSLALITFNIAAFFHLYSAFESQWQGFTDWMSCFMGATNPVKW